MKSLLGLSRFHKQIMAATADLIFLPLTFCLAIVLRHDMLTAELFGRYVWLVVAAPVISIPIFIRLGLYRAVIRFIDQKIVYVVIFGVSLSVVMLTAFAALTSHMAGLSRGVFGIYWATAIMYVRSEER